MRGLVPGLASPYPIGETLPSVFRDDSFTQRWCSAMDDVIAPIIATLDSLPAYLDPATSPEDLLPWLAGWMGIVLDGHQSAERQRELVQIRVELLQWRGTARGVRAAVRALFEMEPELAESGGTTTETIDLDLTVKIPLVGGKIEQLIAGIFSAALDVEQKVGREWLARP